MIVRQQIANAKQDFSQAVQLNFWRKGFRLLTHGLLKVSLCANPKFLVCLHRFQPSFLDPNDR